MPVEPTGHLFRVDRKRGPQWYAKYRLPDGRQVQNHLGPAWAERDRPPAGWLTKRMGEAALRETLDQARQGTLAGMVRTASPSTRPATSTCDGYSRTAAANCRRWPTTARA